MSINWKFDELTTELKTSNGLDVLVMTHRDEGIALVLPPNDHGQPMLEFNKEDMHKFFSAMAGEPVFLMSDVIRLNLGISPSDVSASSLVNQVVSKAFIRISDFLK